MRVNQHARRALRVQSASASDVDVCAACDGARSIRGIAAQTGLTPTEVRARLADDSPHLDRIRPTARLC